MSKTPTTATDDRILESLEKGHYWLGDHYRWLMILVGVVFVSAIYWHFAEKAERSMEANLWAESSVINDLSKAESFIRAHPKAEASRAMRLKAARMALDAGQPDQAKDYCLAFLKEDNVSGMRPVAQLLLAYAYEEMGMEQQASAAYEKVGEINPAWQMVALQAMDRLKAE